MLPKSSRHFIQPTAEELNCNDQLVDDVVGFFYSEIRKSLVEMRDCNIQVENLGSFKAKPTEVLKLFYKYKKQLEDIKTDTFYQMQNKKDLQARLLKVEMLRASIERERERRREFIKEKNERIQKNMAK